MTNYTDLIERLRNSLSNGINEEAADAIEALVKERDALCQFHHDQQELHELNVANAQTNRLLRGELAAANKLSSDRLEQMNADRKAFLDLRKQIEELQPVAWMYQCKHTGDPVLMTEKRDWANSGTGLWMETPLYSLEGIKK